MRYRYLILMIDRTSQEVSWFCAIKDRKFAYDIFWQIFEKNASKLAVDGDTTLEMREMEKPLRYERLVRALQTRIVYREPRTSNGNHKDSL